MKAGLTTSVTLHVAALAFGLLSLPAPAALPPMEESVSVDIVPFSDVPVLVQGAEKAPAKDKPAPMPTKRPDIVADAQKTGENSIDTDKPITPEAKPMPVEEAKAPAPQPKPVDVPKNEDVPKPVEKPTPVPATEVSPKSEPKQDVKPEPVKQAEPTPEPVKQPTPKPTPETAKAEPKPEVKPEVKPDAVAEAIAAEKPAEEAKLPDSAPVPDAKPQAKPAPVETAKAETKPAQAETAKTPDRKEADKPVKTASTKAKSDEKDFNADDISALLNKQKASGGGAKRSTDQASLGAKKTTGEKLSKSEMGALSDQLGGCWTLPIGAEDGGSLRVTVRFNVGEDGRLQGRPQVQTSSGNRQFDESAVRAVQKCDQAGLDLPAGKADIWSEVVVNFDPSDMGM